jgi:thymidylate kinase
MIRYPIIVVEGPDGLGKTTWAREFVRCYRGRYLHLTLRRQMFAHQVMSLAVAIRWSAKCPVVIDRHWPSELIYSEVYRDGSHLKGEAKKLKEIMALIGVFYVFMLGKSPQTMLKRYRMAKEIRPEMYDCDEKYLQLAKNYQLFYEDFVWLYPENTARFDVDNDSLACSLSNAVDQAFCHKRSIEPFGHDNLLETSKHELLRQCNLTPRA